MAVDTNGSEAHNHAETGQDGANGENRGVAKGEANTPVKNASGAKSHLWTKENHPRGGRRRGSLDWSTQLWKAIKTAESVPKRQPFLVHLANRAYANDPVAMKLLDKLVPNRVDPGANTPPPVINIINIGADFRG